MIIVTFSSLVILISILLFIIYSFFFNKNQINILFNTFYLKIHEEIHVAVTPKFIDISPNVKDLIELAIDIWRIEQRMEKSIFLLPENQQTAIKNSLQKLNKYLEKNDIEIIDYTGQKFHEGLNLDILSVEKMVELAQPTVKETIEPTIICKGQIIRKAKIILLSQEG